ncbi:MAG: ABC transporter ATP-binding protein [Oscillospiraceae bacterium]|nr:ABC transporter ATP-binding protein [Oscillospiraceae bacterium]
MLRVDGINVYYGQIHALHEVSFEVNDGEIVTLIGANGAGKSTVLKTVSGIMHSKTGSINFSGEDISRTEPHKIVEKGLSQVPEGRRIFLNMTVKENLEMGAFTNSGVTREDFRAVYDRFPRLYERRRQIAGTLSGGEQQMLAIGRALMIKPKMMMLDEPSMGLAPLLVEQIFGIIRELNEAGTTILLVEQNAAMALSIASRGYVLENGRIVLSDSSEALLGNKAMQKAYLGG